MSIITQIQNIISTFLKKLSAIIIVVHSSYINFLYSRLLKHGYISKPDAAMQQKKCAQNKNKELYSLRSLSSFLFFYSIPTSINNVISILLGVK